MKLTFIGHDHRYAAEQILLMLLPHPPEDAVCTVTLTPDARRAEAVLTLPPRTFSGAIDRAELGADTPSDEKAVQQRLVKLAVFRALCQYTGPNPWGALSGVRPAKLPAKWLRAGTTLSDCRALLTGLYQLSEEKADLALRCAQASAQVDAQLSPQDISLYVGIPFCPTRCAYCSFVSADVKGALALVEPYVDALEREILWARDFLSRRGLRVRSVYFGGGTPTTLSAPQLDRLLTALAPALSPEYLVEYTVEAGRPDTITAQKLAVLRSHGVDRVSVNPQTLSDEVLHAMGRAHTADQFRQAYALAQEAGFAAVNTDLIAGLPADTPEGFRATLDQILSLAPQEITIHTLARKHGSDITNETVSAPVPGPAAVAEMLGYAAQALPAHGYSPYYLYRQKYMTGAMENVGWTRRDRGSFYNIVMMEELHCVLALGAGGMTKLIHRPTGAITRLNNPKYPKEYLERLEDTIREREEIPWPIN